MAMVTGTATVTNGNGKSHGSNLPEIVTLPVANLGGLETPAENRPDQRSNEETIRVRLDKLDNLINMAGELVINKQQNEEHLKRSRN